ncbi:MAG TPA: DUF2934 domain-containing protein [Nitrospira sp.]|nr:DUF2934 domain-containing protein [Nitrospira sp.]
MSVVVKKQRTGKPSSRSGNPPAEKSIGSPDGMWDRIARKAYELWEQRGRQDGYALRDWLDAESIVMEQLHEARE